MSVDYSKVRFSSKNRGKALWSGLVPNEIARTIKQLYYSDMEGIKMKKKIQKKLLDEKSSVCIWTEYLWDRNMAGDYILCITVIKKIKC